MRIGIITIHWGINYGSVLQTYALAHKIEKKMPQSTVEVINYIPRVYSVKRRYFFTNQYRWPRNWLYYVATLPGKLRNQHIFNSFLNHYVPLSSPLYTENEVKKKFSDLDICITGSDQVWNSNYNEGFDPMYYLMFTSSSTKKISYAASCGKNNFDEDEFERAIQALENFDGVSVRETNFEKVLSKFIKCDVVLDPIFLLNHEEWKGISKHVSKLPDHYVLIFWIGPVPDEIKRFATKLAKEIGIKIVSLQFGHIWTYYKNKPIKIILNREPREFLWLIDNADYIVTNSFHGTAFSIHFRKQFYAFKPAYSIRIESLLNIFNLESRLVKSETRETEYIDYANVEIIKKSWIEKSEKFLFSHLQ